MRWLLLAPLAVACAAAVTPPPTEQVVNIAPASPFDAAAPIVAEVPDPTPPPDAASLDVPARDRRNHQPRPRAMLLDELQALESLFASTPKTAIDRPAVIRRLAETYVELRKEAAGKEPNTEAAAGGRAIEWYTLLTREHPHYAQLAETYYYLGLEYEAMRDYANARSSYLGLLARQPASDYASFGYFALGELFVREARWDMALVAYANVNKTAASEMTPWAEWRRGQVFERKGDTASAQSEYATLRRDHPQSEAVKRIGERL